jgi:predicted ribonuclease YlaK
MQSDYTGYKDLVLNQVAMANLYENLNDNVFGCLTNEYVLLRSEDEPDDVKDYLKWNGSRYERVVSKTINNGWTEKIKSRNPQQTLAIDLLMDTDIRVKAIWGKFGVGKDHLMINTALELIKKNKYNKIVWIRNNTSISHVKEIGAIPGEYLISFFLILCHLPINLVE